MPDNRKPTGAPSTPPQSEDWRQIAERASRETNPKKLLELVRHLCALLEKHGAELKSSQPPPP
jgi:hypothetical protein